MNEEIQQHIIIALSKPAGVSDEQFAESTQLISQFQETSEGFEWAINSFSSLNDVYMQVTAIQIIKHWCKFKFEYILDYLGLIREILFNPALHQTFFNSTRSYLGNAQTSFVWMAYPTYFEQFWSILFSFDDQFIMNFLTSFCSFAMRSNLKQSDIIIYNGIKDKMRVDGTDKYLTDYIIQQMQKGDKDAFKCFVSLCAWVPIEYIIGQETSMESLQKGLENEETFDVTLECYSTLVGRGMPADIKNDMLNLLQIPTLIQGIIENFGLYYDLLGPGHLVNETGLQVYQYDSCSTYISLALPFLSSENENVSETVFPFLLQVLKKIPGYSSQILQKALERLSLCFQKLDMTYYTETSLKGYFEHLIDVIHNAIISDYENTERYLMDLCNGLQFNENDIFTLLSLVYSISNVYSGGKKNTESIIGFISVLRPTIYMTISSDIQILAVLEYIKFYVAVCNTIDKNDHQAIYEFMCNTILAQTYQPHLMQQELNNLFALFLKKAARTIEINPQLIFSFLQTFDPTLIAASARMINCLPSDSFLYYYNVCIEQLREIMNRNPNEQVQTLSLVLSFIRSLNYSNEPEHTETVLTYLKELMPLAIQDDSLLSSFIRTVFSSCQQEGTELILSCFQYSNGIHAFTAMSDAVNGLIEKSDDLSWVAEFIGSVAQTNIQAFEGANWNVEQVSEENKEILNMIITFVKCCTCAMNKDLITQELFTIINDFVQRSIDSHFDMPSLMEVFLDFIISIASKKDQEHIQYVYQEYFQRTLLFLVAPNFDVLSKNAWSRVCKRILNLHYTLFDFDNDYFFSVMPGVLEYYKSSPGLTQEYMQIFQLQRPRDRVAAVRQWYIDFAKYKISNGY